MSEPRDARPTLSEATTKRLVFAKYLHRLAADQASRPEPMSAASLLMQHDALELLLQLCTEHLDVGTDRIDFMKYFDVINEAIAPATLPDREAARRLNKARVALKHHGTFPSGLDLIAFQETAESFFRTVTDVVFDVPYASISLAELVTDSGARECLQAADEAVAQGELRDAIMKVAEAFARLLRNRGVRGERLWLDSGLVRDRAFQELARAVDAINGEIALIRQGIDTRRLSVFRQLTPNVAIALAGNVQVIWRGGQAEVTADAVQFCYDFVLDSALQLQDLDRDLDRLKTVAKKLM